MTVSPSPETLSWLFVPSAQGSLRPFGGTSFLPFTCVCVPPRYGRKANSGEVFAGQVWVYRTRYRYQVPYYTVPGYRTVLVQYCTLPYLMTLPVVPGIYCTVPYGTGTGTS